jgi:hypothetical protein
VHGKLVAADSRGVTHLRVTLRTDTDSASTVADEHGEFRLHAPSGGPARLLVTSAGTDSMPLREFLPFMGHVMTVEFRARSVATALLAINQVTTHSAGCADPPEAE